MNLIIIVLILTSLLLLTVGGVVAYKHFSKQADIVKKNGGNKICPNNCSNHGKCVNGQCICLADWKGVDCSTHITEKCPVGTSGPNCDQFVAIKCPPACPGNRECNTRGICQCKDGWAGMKCDMKLIPCPGGCPKNRECIQGKCDCLGGWGGDKCDQRLCAPHNDPQFQEYNKRVCSYHGMCTGDTGCVCDDGWMGGDCSVKTCPGNIWSQEKPVYCLGQGKCVNAVCQCNPGYTGKMCETKTTK